MTSLNAALSPACLPNKYPCSARMPRGAGLAESGHVLESGLDLGSNKRRKMVRNSCGMWGGRVRVGRVHSFELLHDFRGDTHRGCIACCCQCTTDLTSAGECGDFSDSCLGACCCAGMQDGAAGVVTVLLHTVPESLSLFCPKQ